MPVSFFDHAVLNCAKGLRLACCTGCAASVSLMVLPTRFSASGVSPRRKYRWGEGSANSLAKENSALDSLDGYIVWGAKTEILVKT